MQNILGPDGQVLFTVVERIGEGGLGTVYKMADQRAGGSDFAVKVAHISPDDGPEFHRAFLEEVGRAGPVRNRHLVPIWKAGEINGQVAYMVTDHIPGRNLKAQVEEKGAFEPHTASLIARQILKALVTAHDQRYIHRNLTATNVLLRPTMHSSTDAIITDLGLARAAYSFRDPDAGAHRFVTKGGLRFADARYAAPECDDLDHWDVPADLFSVGVLIHLMITGHLPFPRTVDYREWLAGEGKTASALPVHNSVPGPWKPFLRSALATDPDDRYGSAGEMADAIRELGRPKSFLERIFVRKTPSTRPTRRPSTRTGPASSPTLEAVEAHRSTDIVEQSTRIEGATLRATTAYSAGTMELEEIYSPDADTQTATGVPPERASGLDTGNFATLETPDGGKRRLLIVSMVVILLAVIGGGLGVSRFLDKAPPRRPVEPMSPPGMVYLPPVSAELGAAEPGSGELPAYTAVINGFFLDRTEVTCGEYHNTFAGESSRWPSTWAGEPPVDPALPVTGISLEDARAYADARGKRLPTADEWERAARSGGGAYPWGDAFAQDLSGAEAVFPAAHPSRDRTPEGILHLAGNVSEWTDTPLREAANLLFLKRRREVEGYVTVKGGNWRTLNPTSARSSFQAGAVPDQEDGLLGFRCAKDVAP